MNFKMSYEEAKAILAVFYQSPYQVSAPYVAILDNLLNEDGESLKACIDAERAAKAATPNPE